MMNASRVLFVNPSCGQRIGWGAGHNTKASLGFLTAMSKHDYCYSEREAGSGTTERGVWSGHGRNGTASTFHTSLRVTANFLYCTFDWKHI